MALCRALNRQVSSGSIRSRPFSTHSNLFTLNLSPQSLQSSIFSPVAFLIGVNSLLSEIWESILRAVPKKRSSYQKKRSRFLAGKALKDVTALNKCSACGNIKRAHLLCPFCVDGGRKGFSLGLLLVVLINLRRNTQQVERGTEKHGCKIEGRISNLLEQSGWEHFHFGGIAWRSCIVVILSGPLII